MTPQPKGGTPRTDALHKKLVKISEGPDWIAGKDYVDMADFARELERELADLRAENGRIKLNNIRSISQAETEIDALKAENARLRNLSSFVNAAGISAADMPHTVVEKLQKAIDSAMREG